MNKKSLEIITALGSVIVFIILILVSKNCDEIFGQDWGIQLHCYFLLLLWDLQD